MLKKYNELKMWNKCLCCTFFNILMYLFTGMLGGIIFMFFHVYEKMDVISNDISFIKPINNITIWNYQFDNWDYTYNKINNTAYIYDKNNGYMSVDVNKTCINNIILIRAFNKETENYFFDYEEFNGYINSVSANRIRHTFKPWNIGFIAQCILTFFIISILYLIYLFIYNLIALYKEIKSERKN